MHNNHEKLRIEATRTIFNTFRFYNGRPVTKSILTWWAYLDPKQELLPLDTAIEIEHIYAKKRNEMEHSLTNENNLEKLGNKAILEKRINIRASDYRFKDKVVYYNGYYKHGNFKPGTKNHELIMMAKKTDYTESDITTRDSEIIERLLAFIKNNNLAKQ